MDRAKDKKKPAKRRTPKAETAGQFTPEQVVALLALLNFQATMPSKCLVSGEDGVFTYVGPMTVASGVEPSGGVLIPSPI